MNILVIDDDTFTQKALSFFLLNLGHTVTLAGDGIEALHLIEKNANFDLVFCDILMPALSGAGFLLQLKKHYSKKFPVIVIISGIREGEIFLKRIDLKYDYFIKKPFSTDQLQQLMCEVTTQNA